MPLPSASFDLAVAATAVHWFDLGVVLPRLHDALVPGGHLVVWRNAYGDPRAAVKSFRERVFAIVSRRSDGTPRRGPGELDTAAWADRLAGSGSFRVVQTTEFRWSIELRAEQVRDLFTTFSDWSVAEVDEVARAAHDLGGQVVTLARAVSCPFRRVACQRQPPPTVRSASA